MTEATPEEALRNWHRRFAVEANNRAWTLTEQRRLTAAERRELLSAAHAAAHHWSNIGTAAEIAQAELLLGRAHAVLGHGELALEFAASAFETITAGDSEPWEVAFAHAIMADAAAACGDAERHAQYHSQAKALGQALTDPQDRELFLATFDLIPVPS